MLIVAVTFDEFLQMFPDEGFAQRRGAHRAFSTPASVAREGAEARVLFEQWSEAGQPPIRGAVRFPSVTPRADVAVPPPPAFTPTAPRSTSDASEPAPPQTPAAQSPIAQDRPRELVLAGAPASTPASEERLTGWARVKHELTRKR